MIDMNAKYDNMHKNEIVYVLICINNHIITSINFILSTTQSPLETFLSYLICNVLVIP